MMQHDTRVTELVAALVSHVPIDTQERSSLSTTLAALDELVAPFDQHASPTHVTASAIVVDERLRVLLHRHKRLGIWLQPGGHVEEGEDLHEAAMREVLEETGVHASVHAASHAPLHVDVHPGPRGHTHLDIRYLLQADGNAPFNPYEGESPAVAWDDCNEILAHGEQSLAAAVRAAQRALAASASD